MPLTNRYHVPAALQQHIDYITPGVKLASHGFDERVKALRRRREDRATAKPKLQRRKSEDVAGAEAVPFWVTGGCDEFSTLECIRAQYNLPSSTTKVAPVPGNEVGIYESMNNHYSKDDLDGLYYYAAPEIPKGTYPELRAINGASGASPSQDTAGGEGNVDLMVAMPLVWPQKTVLFDTDDDYYQNAMATGSSQVGGTFNSKFPSPTMYSLASLTPCSPLRRHRRQLLHA